MCKQTAPFRVPIYHTGPPPPRRHDRALYDPRARAAAAALDQARRLRGLPAQGAAAARDRHLQGRPRGRAAPAVCLRVAETLGSFQPIAGAGMVSPFCERICWSSCHGESHAGGNDDGFPVARPRAARSRRASTFCSPSARPPCTTQLQNMYDKNACSRTRRHAATRRRRACAAQPPSSAAAAADPACRRRRRRRPRPTTERERDAELDSDPDCIPVSYRTCAGSSPTRARVQGTADVLTVSFRRARARGRGGLLRRLLATARQRRPLPRASCPRWRRSSTAPTRSAASISDLPLCACANKNPDAFIFPPPPPYVFAETFHGLPAYEEGEHDAGRRRGAV